MHLRERGLVFSQMGRHLQVTQCLASLEGKQWLMAFVPPADLDDEAARPPLEAIMAFRIPGTCAIKLHLGTWHAGPHFAYREGLFLNLENLDTNRRDFHAAQLAVSLRIEA